jgi:hypothetical protein
MRAFTFLSLAFLCLCLLQTGCCSSRLSATLDQDALIVVLKSHLTSAAESPLAANISLFFISVEDKRQCDALVAFWGTNNTPLLCDTNRIAITGEGLVADRVTGVHASIFSTRIESLRFPHAVAISTQHSGTTSAETFRYRLLYSNRQWRIVSRSLVTMASSENVATNRIAFAPKRKSR